MGTYELERRWGQRMSVVEGSTKDLPKSASCSVGFDKTPGEGGGRPHEIRGIRWFPIKWPLLYYAHKYQRHRPDPFLHHLQRPQIHMVRTHLVSSISSLWKEWSCTLLGSRGHCNWHCNWLWIISLSDDICLPPKHCPHWSFSWHVR